MEGITFRNQWYINHVKTMFAPLKTTMKTHMAGITEYQWKFNLVNLSFNLDL